MKKTFFKLVTLVTICATSTVFAQVGVGVPAGDIHPSAELEVKSTTKGFLPPRMTNTERNSINAPATGLLIFQTDAVTNNPAGLYFFDGTAWRNGAGIVGVKGDQGDVGPKGDQGGVTSKIYAIGHWPELGGYVFRISADGTHGLVAETQDQSVGTSWYVAQDVISNPVNHSTNGKKFMDWRLPTNHELSEMYLQKGAIGGFSSAAYWSSSEAISNSAWNFYFHNGYASYYDKGRTYFVRSVRAF